MRQISSPGDFPAPMNATSWLIVEIEDWKKIQEMLDIELRPIFIENSR
jgi:hypothetical protein